MTPGRPKRGRPNRPTRRAPQRSNTCATTPATWCPSWPVSAFGVLGLLLGLVVNLVLVGACLWIGGRLLGVLLRASGILTGLGTEDPRLQLTYAGLGCAVLAGVGILVSWWAYLRDRVPAGGMGRQQRPRALTVSWWRWRPRPSARCSWWRPRGGRGPLPPGPLPGR